MSTGITPISKNIKQLRKELDISQDELSKMADVSYNTIVKIETDSTKNPTIDTLQKIAEALDVSVDELISKN